MLAEFNQRHSRSAVVIVYLLTVVVVLTALAVAGPRLPDGPVYPVLGAAAIPLAATIFLALARRGRLAITCLIGFVWVVGIVAAIILLAGLYFLTHMSGNWK